MAETITPAKHKAPMASRIQSPTSPFFLGSNEDQLERAQARAARAAAGRRKQAVPPLPSDPSDLFNKGQILELFQNCIKLASENKINQKNTWDLSLIDHLNEIIRVESEDVTETNFQKASCTLDAGVKIYSLRVDSVHSEAYKVLGGINRVGREDQEDKEPTTEGHQVDTAQEEGHSKKEIGRKISPLSTLESSFKALNAKKFDVAFTVDPLYHQSSAQFDEVGAKGLLLNNLGVYGGCQVLFDSLETPWKSMQCAAQNDRSEMIDISFTRECIEEMVTCMPGKSNISPTLKDIVNQFDEDNRRPSYVLSVGQKPMDQDDAACNDQPEWEGDAFDDCGGPCSFDLEGQTSVLDESSTFADAHSESLNEENYDCSFHEPDIEDSSEKIAGLLSLGLGFISKQNAWAGPDHWKYRKAKGRDCKCRCQFQKVDQKYFLRDQRPRNRQPLRDIDFTKSLDTKLSEIFILPKNPKSLFLPANRGPCNTSLPEDCHYQPEDLVKLFLLPNVLCLEKKGRKSWDDSRPQKHAYEPSWDNESMISDHFDDGNVLSDVEDSTSLVSQPRQVNKIEVQYDKSSKQVDVHALKETIWNCIQESTKTIQMGNEAVASFRHVLSNIPADCIAAAAKDISPHLCFICLLHLANEHGLSIQDCTTLDELRVDFPLQVQ